MLGESILIHPSQQGPALGAAVLGAIAAGKRAGGFSSVRSAVRTMGGVKKGVPAREGRLIAPNRRNTRAYEPIYRRYRETASFLNGERSRE